VLLNDSYYNTGTVGGAIYFWLVLTKDGSATSFRQKHDPQITWISFIKKSANVFRISVIGEICGCCLWPKSLQILHNKIGHHLSHVFDQ
jgi:hypothetical protein